MDQGRGSDQDIAVGSWIGNMQSRAALRYRGVDRQDTPLKSRKNLIVDPIAQASALGGILPGYQQETQLDF